MKIDEFRDEYSLAPIDLLSMAETITSELEQTSPETLALLVAAQAFSEAHDALLIEMNELGIELG